MPKSAVYKHFLIPRFTSIDIKQVAEFAVFICEERLWTHCIYCTLEFREYYILNLTVEYYSECVDCLGDVSIKSNFVFTLTSVTYTYSYLYSAIYISLIARSKFLADQLFSNFVTHLKSYLRTFLLPIVLFEQ